MLIIYSNHYPNAVYKKSILRTIHRYLQTIIKILTIEQRKIVQSTKRSLLRISKPGMVDIMVVELKLKTQGSYYDIATAHKMDENFF